MKKTMMALCSAIIILASSLLTPASVCAVERSCAHEYNSTVSGFCYTHSSHPYVVNNGVNGPEYGTCHITVFNSCEYFKCWKCDYVNYSNPINLHYVSESHDSCPLSH